MSFLRSVRDLGAGDHACLVYDGADRRDELLLAFFEEGVRRGERLIYLDNGDVSEVVAQLESLAAPGQLTVLPAEEAFLADGEFRPDGVVAGWRAALEASSAGGGAAVRAAGTPPVALTCNGQSHDLVSYERQAAELFDGAAFCALCAYDVRQTLPAALLGLVDAHPVVLYAVGLDDRLRVEASARELALRGWIDLTTLGSLVGPLSDAVATDGDLEVDLRDVEFVDSAGWRLLSEAAGMLGSRGRTLTIRSAPDWAASVLRILGYTDEGSMVLG